MLRRRRDKEKHPRFKGLTFNKIVPNAITVAATCFGLSGIRFAIEGRWEFAAAAILIAAILDTLDGRMARLLNASSNFGAELDSLSDFVSFGVAPALIIYYWSLQFLPGFGWAVALFFAVCMGLRLARFNSMLDKLPSYAYNYFQGVPAPASAGLCLLPLVISFVFGPQSTLPVIGCAIWVVIVALMTVSSMPTFSFKKMKIPSKMIIPTLAIVALAIALLISRPWITMSIVLVAYLLTIPFAISSYGKLKREAERIKGNEDPKDSDDDSVPKKIGPA